MLKPLSQVQPFYRGQRQLSASAMQAIRDTVQRLARNITVSAPLEADVSPAGIHIRVDEAELGVPIGGQGAILEHDGMAWVAKAPPPWAAVLGFHIAVGMPVWIAATAHC